MFSFHLPLSYLAFSFLTSVSPDHKEVKLSSFLVHAKFRLSITQMTEKIKSKFEDLVSVLPQILVCLRDQCWASKRKPHLTPGVP
jgi:hypothetical protein